MLTSLPKSSQKRYVLFLWQTSPFSSPPHLELSGPPGPRRPRPRPITKPALVSRMPHVITESGQARAALGMWLLAHCRAVGAPKAFTWFWTNRSIRLKLLQPIRSVFPFNILSGVALPGTPLHPGVSEQVVLCHVLHLVERSVFSLSFHVTFRSLPWFQNLSWSPPGQKFRQFMASVEVSGWY